MLHLQSVSNILQLNAPLAECFQYSTTLLTPDHFKVILIQP